MIYFIALILFYVLSVWYVHGVLRGRQIIRREDGVPYLVRYFIYRPNWLDKIGIDSKKAGRIYLHHILRSDHDISNHDHPWAYRSLIVKGGYREFTTAKTVCDNVDFAKPNPQKWDFANWPKDRESVFADFKAGQYLKRPAEWKHRLEIPEGKTTWTLVFIGAKTRSWGFWPGGKFCPWKKYNTGTGLCEESE
jgi:hypothetical protein